MSDRFRRAVLQAAAALAKPASEPAGGGVDEIERLTKERNEHANYAAEAIEQRAEMEAQLNSLIRAGGDLRAVSDNGKRWRIVPVDGDWEMVPVGHITARQAEALCKRIAAAALSSSAGPAVEAVAWRYRLFRETSKWTYETRKTEVDCRRNANYEIEALYAHPAPTTVGSECDTDFLRQRRGELVIERDAARDAVEDLIAAIGNDGKVTSLHEWNERMQRAVADAKTAIARNVRKERAALAPATEGRKG